MVSSSTPIGVMRIAKRIARSGVCSRREAERLIGEGRVMVNNVLISSPALNVSIKDRVLVDGKEITPIQRTRVVLAHKLPGELITTQDEKGREFISTSLFRSSNYL